MALVQQADTGTTISGSSGSFNHTHAPGSDGFLCLVLQRQTDKSVTTFDFNGDAATLVTSGDAGSSRSWDLYRIIAPDVGTYLVNFALNANPTYASYIWVCSFTGCSGIIQSIVQAPMTDPALFTFSSAIVSGNLVLCGGMGVGYTAGLDVKIPNGTDGTSLDSRLLTALGQVEAEVNANPISGTTQVKISAPLANPTISLWAVEIGEAGGGPAPRRRIITC